VRELPGSVNDNVVNNCKIDNNQNHDNADLSNGSCDHDSANFIGSHDCTGRGVLSTDVFRMLRRFRCVSFGDGADKLGLRSRRRVVSELPSEWRSVWVDRLLLCDCVLRRKRVRAVLSAVAAVECAVSWPCDIDMHERKPTAAGRSGAGRSRFVVQCDFQS